jgi:hypothetical protein
VISLLLDGGLRVTAVQLPLISLKDDVATVKRAIALEDGPIILVGHSYGDVVITEAGNDPKVAGLIYVAAFAPDVGQSVGSLGASVEPAPMGAEVRPDAQGFLKLTEAGVKNDFVQDLTPIEKSILFAAQAPTAAAALGENISVASWKAKPSWYLVATADRAIQPSLERAMAKAINAKTVEIASSHVAMLARPEETANLILEAAGRASPSNVGLKSAFAPDGRKADAGEPPSAQTRRRLGCYCPKNGPKAHSRHPCPNTFDGVAPARWVREIVLSIAEQLRSEEGCER